MGGNHSKSHRSPRHVSSLQKGEKDFDITRGALIQWVERTQLGRTSLLAVINHFHEIVGQDDYVTVDSVSQLLAFAHPLIFVGAHLSVQAFSGCAAIAHYIAKVRNAPLLDRLQADIGPASDDHNSDDSVNTKHTRRKTRFHWRRGHVYPGLEQFVLALSLILAKSKPERIQFLIAALFSVSDKLHFPVIDEHDVSCFLAPHNLRQSVTGTDREKNKSVSSNDFASVSSEDDGISYQEGSSSVKFHRWGNVCVYESFPVAVIRARLLVLMQSYGQDAHWSIEQVLQSFDNAFPLSARRADSIHADSKFQDNGPFARTQNNFSNRHNGQYDPEDNLRRDTDKLVCLEKLPDSNVLYGRHISTQAFVGWACNNTAAVSLFGLNAQLLNFVRQISANRARPVHEDNNAQEGYPAQTSNAVSPSHSTGDHDDSQKITPPAQAQGIAEKLAEKGWKRAWCSYCYQYCLHSLVEPGVINRDIHICENCGKRNQECVAMGCTSRTRCNRLRCAVHHSLGNIVWSIHSWENPPSALNDDSPGKCSFCGVHAQHAKSTVFVHNSQGIVVRECSACKRFIHRCVRCLHHFSPVLSRYHVENCAWCMGVGESVLDDENYARSVGEQRQTETSNGSKISTTNENEINHQTHIAPVGIDNVIASVFKTRQSADNVTKYPPNALSDVRVPGVCGFDSFTEADIDRYSGVDNRIELTASDFYTMYASLEMQFRRAQYRAVLQQVAENNPFAFKGRYLSSKGSSKGSTGNDETQSASTEFSVVTDSLPNFSSIWTHFQLNAHAGNFRIHNPFLPAQPWTRNTPVYPIVDAECYFDLTAELFSQAQHDIFISGWFFADFIYLRRKPLRDRLDALLLSKAAQGVHIYILLWSEVSFVRDTIYPGSLFNKKRLRRYHKNIHCIAHPELAHFVGKTPADSIVWSHHQKFCVIDQCIAMVGGIDYLVGRWDNWQHRLFDVESHVWLGLDYKSPYREPDEHCIEEPFRDVVDRTKYPRQAHHDVQCLVTGRAAYDIARTFTLRWNHHRKPHHRMIVLRRFWGTDDCCSKDVTIDVGNSKNSLGFHTSKVGSAKTGTSLNEENSECTQNTTECTTLNSLLIIPTRKYFEQIVQGFESQFYNKAELDSKTTTPDQILQHCIEDMHIPLKLLDWREHEFSPDDLAKAMSVPIDPSKNVSSEAVHLKMKEFMQTARSLMDAEAGLEDDQCSSVIDDEQQTSLAFELPMKTTSQPDFATDLEEAVTSGAGHAVELPKSGRFGHKRKHRGSNRNPRPSSTSVCMPCGTCSERMVDTPEDYQGGHAMQSRHSKIDSAPQRSAISEKSTKHFASHRSPSSRPKSHRLGRLRHAFQFSVARARQLKTQTRKHQHARKAARARRQISRESRKAGRISNKSDQSSFGFFQAPKSENESPASSTTEPISASAVNITENMPEESDHARSSPPPAPMGHDTHLVDTEISSTVQEPNNVQTSSTTVHTPGRAKLTKQLVYTSNGTGAATNIADKTFEICPRRPEITSDTSVTPVPSVRTLETENEADEIWVSVPQGPFRGSGALEIPVPASAPGVDAIASSIGPSSLAESHDTQSLEQLSPLDTQIASPVNAFGHVNKNWTDVVAYDADAKPGTTAANAMQGIEKQIGENNDTKPEQIDTQTDNEQPSTIVRSKTSSLLDSVRSVLPEEVNAPYFNLLSSFPRASARMLTSMGPWSGAAAVRRETYGEYLRLIDTSEHYIYIENQYVVSATAGAGIQNKVTIALWQRLRRAIQNQETFRVIICVPFPEEEGGGWRVIVNYEHRTLWRGRYSLLGRLQEEFPGVDLSDYLCFLMTRTYDFTGRLLQSDQVFVHSKMMIVDDRFAIISSANVNDRSLWGDRDSEMGCIIGSDALAPGQLSLSEESLYKRPDVEKSKMDGKPYWVSIAVHRLRCRVWREFLGLACDSDSIVKMHLDQLQKDRTIPSLTGIDIRSSAVKEADVYIQDPCISSVYHGILVSTAKTNARILEHVFAETPSDEYRNYDALKKARQRYPYPIDAHLLAGVRGFFVWAPIHYLEDEDLELRMTDKEYYLASYAMQ